MASVDATWPLIRLARDADPAGMYVRCDAAALPFADESFDLAVFYNSLMDIDDMESAVREAARVLRQGGAMVACVTHPIADAGLFSSREADAAFVIEDTYLGSRRWLDLPIERDGLFMASRAGRTRSRVTSGRWSVQVLSSRRFASLRANNGGTASPTS